METILTWYLYFTLISTVLLFIGIVGTLRQGATKVALYCAKWLALLLTNLVAVWLLKPWLLKEIGPDIPPDYLEPTAFLLILIFPVSIFMIHYMSEYVLYTIRVWLPLHKSED